MAKTVKIPKSFRRVIYGIFMLSWVTGIVFFSMNQWILIEGEFGPEKHPWQFNFLKIHGASAFLMMVGFGYLLGSHIQFSWPVKRMRPTGLVLTFAVTFLILSAYGLYYLGDDTWRTWLSYAHASVGVSLPIILIYHLYVGRKRKNRRALESFR